MTREEAIEELSPLYRRAVALVASGVEEVAELAARLDVPPESVPALLHLANAKLAKAMTL